MLALRLPACPAALPDMLVEGSSVLHVLDNAEPHPIRQALREWMARAGASPHALAGSDSTPAAWWLLAARQFAHAQLWCYVQAQQRWVLLSDAGAAGACGVLPTPGVAAGPVAGPVPALPVKPAAASIRPPDVKTPQAAPPAVPRPTAASGRYAELTDGDLQFETFKRASWGPSPERLRDLDALQEEALRKGRPPWLGQQVARMRSKGEQAFALGQQMLVLLRQDGEAAARQWMEQQSKADTHLARHLGIVLKKELEFMQIQRQRRAVSQAQQRKSGVHVALRDGQHPNSLRRQAPQAHWRIYIDETGERFDASADELPPSDRAVGRMVALAVPAGAKLPKLQGFHGSEAMPGAVDEVLQRLLDAPVGILGFSVQDSSARQAYWIGQVLHLVRWTLLQLPVPADAPSCRVELHIEQKDSYTSADSLAIVSATLESEFRALDPQRFAQLSVTMRFVDKNDPYCGYADAIAFTWGSPAAISKDRLKKSLLRGHCLVDAQQSSLHHLYLHVSQRSALVPSDWYALCSAASSEPAQGFLARTLERLGQGEAQDLAPWHGYLADVQRRLASKQYRLEELSHAIDWLQRHVPPGQVLPGALRLVLQSSRLALNNHQGHADAALLCECLELVSQLRDEDPQQACEALLRVATATTNAFEFDALRAAVQEWLALPVAVPGLLLHGKLHSTLGQIDAFMGQPEAALLSFDRALQAFARLSDPAQAQRESNQTRSYRLIAQMDASRAADGAGTPALVQAVLAHWNDADPLALSRKLAHSGQDRRFEQYLWLRTLTHLPTHFADARQAYCALQAQWQSGQDHPWPLIEAYRAWMLHDAGEPKAAAECMQWAIENCSSADHGPTLKWIAEVLRTLGQALDMVPADQAPSLAQRAALQALLPNAHHGALTDFAAQAALVAPMGRALVLQHLAACLPYNFH